jgi:hypothetical protein
MSAKKLTVITHPAIIIGPIIAIKRKIPGRRKLFLGGGEKR